MVKSVGSQVGGWVISVGGLKKEGGPFFQRGELTGGSIAVQVRSAVLQSSIVRRSARRGKSGVGDLGHRAKRLWLGYPARCKSSPQSFQV